MSQINADKPLIQSPNHFPVVGIGASAGGLDAFKKLLKAIPENSGMAYVLVQHLHPGHESMLSDILQKVTKIPVLEITDDIKVLPNHIYIIPSNKMMIANDGVLLLSPRTAKKDERNLPIDVFFTSLAEVHQSHSIGVVLSGTASDGTKGLKAIKDHGGITFAQDAESAAYDSMPNSAIQAGVVDFILPPEEIPQKLLAVIKITNGKEADDETLPQQDEAAFKQILSLLRLRKGTDFTYYKQTTIRRRILRRMALSKNEVPADYLKLLRENIQEQDILYQDLLIPVTSFFRDSKTFDNLYETVFTQILKKNIAPLRAGAEPIRIWVAGCSTGQEVYSMAICLKEFLALTPILSPDKNGGRHGEGVQVQIFGTDISEPAIAKARTGIYTKSELEGLSPGRLKEFFTKNNGGYQLNRQLRDMCVFAVHNFLKDPPFGKLDLISCRNVLIYMEPYLQKKALTTFHYALNNNGFLLLGKSETTSSVPDLFALSMPKDKIFSRKDVPAKYLHSTSHFSNQSLHNTDEATNGKNIRTDFQKAADDVMLSKYTPAGVVVNEAMDIVHFRGKTGNYLENLPGKPSHNLLKMAKDGLAFELRNILHKAKKERAVVIKENIPVKDNGVLRNISIEAMPLPDTIEPHYLILFHEEQPRAMSHELPAKTKKALAHSSQLTAQSRIEQLEKELAQAREDMRSITEDQEAVNEELQSANEELLSGSEELQSLNEELETGKEELQSTNEELTVVNQEMFGLNEQVSAARNYAEAIIATIREPLLVLDKHLRIQTANSAFYKTFQVNEKDTEGRLIYELGDKQWNIPALRKLLEEILPKKNLFTDFEVRHRFPNIGDRVMLLNAREISTENGVEKLILLAVEDVTERDTARKKIEDSNKRYHLMLMQSPFAFSIMKGKDMMITLANNLMKEFWRKGNEVEGKTLLQVLPELADQPFPGMIDSVYTTGKPVYANEMLALLNHNGKMEEHYFNIVYQPHLEADQTISGVITIAHEVTNMVQARKKLQLQADMVTDLLMNAPGFVATLSGPEHVYELVNEQYQSLFGKRKIQGKPIMVALPELEGQGFDKLLDKVYNTGEPYVGINIPIALSRDENLAPEERYFNFSYQPMYDENKNIFSILVFGYEVTVQVIATKKIEESEAFSRSVLNNSPDCIKILDTEGRVQFMNDNGICVMEIDDFSKVKNNYWWDLWEEENQPMIKDAVTKALSGERVQFQSMSNTAKGTPKWWDVIVAPILVDGTTEKVQRIISVSRDITDYKDATLKVEESEKRYNNLIAFSSSAIGILQGEDMVITTANNAIMDIWGKGKDVFGKKYFEMLPELADQGYREVFAEVYKTGKPFNALETPVKILQNGKMELKYYNFLLQAQLNINGEIEGVGIIANEVTSQALLNLKIKASEEKFRLLVLQAPVAICVLRGENYVIETINEGMFEMWDRTLEQALNKPAFDVLPELREQGFKELLDNVYNTGERFVAEELPIQLKRNGKLENVFVKFIYEPLREADGTISGVMALAHEITEQVLSRKKIEESETKFRTLIEDAPVATCLFTGREMTIEVANDKMIGYWGKDKNVIGKPLADAVPELKGQPFLKRLDEVFTTGKMYEAKNEVAQLELNGVLGTYYFDYTYKPIFNAAGEVYGIMDMAVDVTEQRQVQSMLEYRKALLEAHNESSVDGILLVDAKGKIISYNKRFVEIWNMPQHITDANDDEAALAFAMTQLVYPEQFIEKVKYLYDNPAKISTDILEFNDGKIVERHGYPVIADDGSYYAWSWTFRDITEVKKADRVIRESEKNFRQLAELMPDKITTTNPDGYATYFNRNWVDYTGLSMEELIGWGWGKIMHPDEIENINKHWQHSLETGENFEMEMQCLNKNNEFRWHLTRASAIKDTEGKIKNWIGATTEIQKIKEEEQRKSDFMAMVSHELKTPVTSIKGYVQLLLNMLKMEPQTELAGLPLLSSLTRIDSQVLRLTRLITEILDLTRLETGKLELKNELFSLNKLVAETVQDITFTNTKHTINIHQDFTGMVDGDKDRIGQVLINLINNAVKYSTDNNSIDVNIHQPEKNLIAVSVKDYGIGIDKAEQQKIFERFYRAVGKSEQTYAGFGIGLYIANEIIERHQGFISVESEKGKGSVFTFTLPLATENEI